jgi:hypothetical protein
MGICSWNGFNVNRLIICEGNSDCWIDDYPGDTYIYRIRGASVSGGNWIELNDSRRLNSIAEGIRDEYSAWVNTFTSEYSDVPYELWGFSAFHFSDLSCKRTEIFDTFNTICNLLLIMEKLRGIDIDEVYSIEIGSDICCAVESLFPGAKFRRKRVVINRWRKIRDLVSDVRFATYTVVSIGICKYFWQKHQRRVLHPAKGYVTLFPIMNTSDNFDKKYGGLVTSKDVFYAFVLTDGMHQNLAPLKFLQAVRRLKGSGNIVLVDRFISLKDVIAGIRTRFALKCLALKKRHNRYKFQGIDVTSLIEVERSVSHRRIWRLIILGSALAKAVKDNAPKELIYYLFEYPLGRAITAVMKTTAPTTLLSGFQHGPASWRKLVCFIGPRMLGENGSMKDIVPIPDRIYVEDKFAKDIYLWGGYKNVFVMHKVYRLGYLETVREAGAGNNCLIAPGLNDGAILLRTIAEKISRSTNVKYLLKPHPLANNAYINEYKHIQNLEVTQAPLSELFSQVNEVYVSYSSVGAEAQQLGIDVTVVDIPGVISQSPLQDQVA